MYLIGLTGGIASGKSTVSEWLKKKGVTVIDADQLARIAVEPNTEGLRAIVDTFGRDILKYDGTLDRTKLRDLIFDDVNARKKINDILHGAIKEMMKEEVEKASLRKEKIVFCDVPLLIETGWHTEMDEVWLVDVKKEVQISRLMKRNGCSFEAAKKILASQMTGEEKKAYAHLVIDNNGTVKELYDTLERVWKEKELFERGREVKM